MDTNSLDAYFADLAAQAASWDRDSAGSRFPAKKYLFHDWGKPNEVQWSRKEVRKYSFKEFLHDLIAAEISRSSMRKPKKNNDPFAEPSRWFVGYIDAVYFKHGHYLDVSPVHLAKGHNCNLCFFFNLVLSSDAIYVKIN